MRNYYITHDNSGYVVMHRTVAETERHVPVVCFGNSEKDATAFRDGCEKGYVPSKQISLYEGIYAARPMRYTCYGFAVPLHYWEERP